MPMPTLSKETEANILSALQEVVDAVDGGLEPSAAIVKVAKDNKIPDGHIKIMVYAYNNGKHTAQRKSASDRAGKAEEFPIANYEEIMNQIYPSKIKTSAEVYSEICVADEYTKSPSWLNERSRQEKQAQIIKAANQTKKPAVKPVRQDDMTGILSNLNKLNTECELAYSKVARAHNSVEKALNSLDKYFKLSIHKPFNEVFENSVLMFGKEAMALRDTILEKNRHLKKEASVSTLAPAEGQPYDLIDDCIASAREWLEAKKNLSLVVKNAENKRKEYLKPLDKLLPITTEKIGGSVLEDDSAEDCDSRGLFQLPFCETKSALFGKPITDIAKLTAVGGLAKGLGDRVFGPKPSAPRVPTSIVDPAHATELRNIQLESMLSDLLSNDPILQGHNNPDEVLSAYNEISQMAPRASANKAIARAFLRKWVTQGQLADFDLKTLSEMEDKLRQSGSPGTTPPTIARQEVGASNA